MKENSIIIEIHGSHQDLSRCAKSLAEADDTRATQDPSKPRIEHCDVQHGRGLIIDVGAVLQFVVSVPVGIACGVISNYIYDILKQYVSRGSDVKIGSGKPFAWISDERMKPKIEKEVAGELMHADQTTNTEGPNNAVEATATSSSVPSAATPPPPHQ